MKTIQNIIALSILLVLLFSCNNTEQNTVATETEPVTVSLAPGRQPQVAVAPDGVARIVYGESEKIYCVTSADNGNTFSKPVLIDSLAGLYLGMSMGPQIASSANYSVVTAIDKKGNIHSYSLLHDTGTWTKAAGVNDVPGTVPEGLISLESDEQDTFYAVWLDVRNDKQNKIVFATSDDAAQTWTANKVIYRSPDKTVCECCKPSIEVQEDQVVVMFRNWLDGSRDFYLTSSDNGGKAFSQPKKLGHGTWKLEGCPMDGGGILLDSTNTIHTVWQREGNIYYATSGGKEVQIGNGRNCRISGSGNPVITWNDGTELKLKKLDSDKILTVGTGSYLESAELADDSRLLVWENDKKVYLKKL